MRRLIVQEWISLDGFATGRNASLDFFAPDELHVHVCPLITGGGGRLFTGENNKALKLTNSKRFDSGVVSLHYQA